MGTSIQYGFNAYTAQSNISSASALASASIARLSSGNRIQQASDDVAGLSIGTSLLSRVTSLRSGLNNATQGTSLLQVADGSISQIISILQQQISLATQANSGSLTDTDRALLNTQFQSLTAQIDTIANGTNFNNVSLLNGGLGSKTRLATTNALASTAISVAPFLNSTGGAATTSTTAIQAFDLNAGTSRAGTGTQGFLQLTDSGGNVLANSAYDSVNSSVYGQFSNFTFSNVTYGASGVGTGTLNATLNGVTYSGSVLSGASATALLRNGNTYINVGLGSVSLTDAGAQSTSTNNITNAFSTTVIGRTNTIQGVDFSGTALAGATGGANGNASIRLNTSGTATISNFQYIGNTGAANTNTLTVQVNGETYTATGVNDQIVSKPIQFVSNGRTQVLNIDFTNLTTNINNIRTSTTDRANFLNALNIGFGKSGSGLSFNLGSGSTDSINVQLGNLTSSALFGGTTIDVATATTAGTASTVLATAVNTALSQQATVGALESRFNFATNALQSSIEGQDAARGLFLDTDVAAESTAFAAYQVQIQAGIAVLAQANQLSDKLLKLLN